MEQGINAGNILLTRFNKNKSNLSLLIQDFVIKKPDMAKNMITPIPPKVVIPRKVGSDNPESEYWWEIITIIAANNLIISKQLFLCSLLFILWTFKD